MSAVLYVRDRMVVFDFETYFDAKYSLTNYSYTEYIHDEKFKVHGAAVKVGRNAAYWLPAEAIPAFLQSHQEDTFVFHNASFDVAILSLHYDFMPRRVMDTRLIAALLVGWYTRCNLAVLADYFNCPYRKGAELVLSKGVRVLSDTPGLEAKIAAYSCTDVEITHWLLHHLLTNAAKISGLDPETLKKELRVMDLTIQLIKSPHQRDQSLHVNLPLLLEAVQEEAQAETRDVRELAAQYQYSEAEFVRMLRSRALFPAFMERLGVSIPTKLSKTTGKPTYALGKTDTALVALRERLAGTAVGALFDFREKLGSTIRRTRSVRLTNMATPLRLPGHDTAPVPVFLNYAGADKTLRWSGGNKVNMQNLPRGSVLRQALVPPPGHKLVVCDYSSIEARVLAWLADDTTLLDVFQRGEDVYTRFGRIVWPSTMMDGSGDPETSDAYKSFKSRRFVAKTCVLGLGYGASWPVLEGVLRTGSMGAKVVLDEATARGIGVTRDDVIAALRERKAWVLQDEETGEARWAALMAPLKRDPTLLWHFGACMRLVEIYRSEYWPVTAFWKAMEPARLLQVHQVGRIACSVQGEDLSLQLPGGTRLVFPQMRAETRGASYIRAGVGMHTYGAKMVENVTQSVARNLLRDAWIQAHAAGLEVVLTVHDEIVCVAKEADALAAAQQLTAIMSTSPVWAEGMPVAAEASVIDSYADK